MAPVPMRLNDLEGQVTFADCNLSSCHTSWNETWTY